MLDERFWSKVDKTDYCWNWKSSLDQKGYPQFFMDGQCRRAHRLAYKEYFGSIPDELTVDHICRNRKCVNPKHLRLLTNKENILCGNGSPAQNARKIVCKRGHILISGKSKQNPEWRICLVCARESTKNWLFNRRQR